MRRPSARVGDVLLDGHVREERVFLEDEAHPALLRRSVDACSRVEEDPRAERYPAAFRLREAGDAPEDARLACAGRPDEREGLASDGERQLEPKRAKGEGDVEVERVHAGISLTRRRIMALTTTSNAASASATSKWMSNCA